MSDLPSGKFHSATNDLPSKLWLKETRDQVYNKHLLEARDKLGKFHQFWTPAETARHNGYWGQADSDYESRKAALRAQLLQLSPADLTLYFNEIKVAEVSVNEYLAPS
jgi:hypothetical protein